MENDAVPTWEHLRALLMEDRATELDSYLATLSGAETVRALFRLDEAEQRQLLTSVSPSSAAEIMEDVPDEIGADLIETLSVEDAASIVAAILDEMEAESAAETRELMSYPPDSAGGLMVTEYLVYPARTTAGRVVEDISSGTRDLSRHLLQHAFVTDRAGRLLGIVRFRDLVFALPETRLREIMSRPIVINAGADLDVMRGCFDEVGFMALPVTADQGVLCGVLLRSDVDEALAAKAAEDHLKSQGILGGEELRTMPVALRSRRRLSWLSVNIFLNMIAASVIAAFEETLTAVVALAVFLPIVSDMSGCSGNQAVAVSMRELTLGIAGVRDSFRVWWQEIKVGVINGLVLGMLLAVAAWAWRGSPVLGLIVGAALSVNTLVAVSIGGTVPLLLKRFGADPAVASGPVLTTVTDMCGFFLVLGIATILLPWI
jgi:magnesium transporter